MYFFQMAQKNERTSDQTELWVTMTKIQDKIAINLEKLEMKNIKENDEIWKIWGKQFHKILYANVTNYEGMFLA